MPVSVKLPRKVGGNAEPELSADRAQLVQPLHGRHYEDVLAGRVFSQTPTPVGLLLPIYTATALGSATVSGVPIWNPSSSNVNVELIYASLAYASGTAEYAAVGLMHRKGLGTDIAGGTAITAFAETDPKNRLLGAGTASQVKSSNAGTITITNATATAWARTLFGINLEVEAGTGTETVTGTYDFNGTVIVPPGSMVWLASGRSSAAKYSMSICWKELPIRR